jgi:LuxR family maltose regulon positive regulatory protein
VKTWLAQNTDDSLKQAGDLLTSLHNLSESTHNNRFLMDILIQESILSARQGDVPSALELLNQAINIARPAGFIRNFLDAGPELANLLRQEEKPLNPYVRQILKSFGPEISIKMRTEGVMTAGNLTNREIKVLGLLAQRLSNKEIAEQMIISSGTVKSYTIRIYQKLHAKNRRQAVENAITLGIIIQA